MVSPRSSIEAITKAIADSGKLPSELSVLLQEADQTYEDADVDLPLLEIQITEVDNVSVENTDFVGWTTDEYGNQTGRIYYSEYEMTLQLALWTTKDDGYDPDDLGEKLREALYPYSSYGPQESFKDDQDNSIDQIFYFRLDNGERTDDLIQTPTVRRWTQEVELWASEEFRTTEDYIVSVDFPTDENLSGSDETISNI